MKLQFKEQSFQLDAVKSVVNCFIGQPLRSNHFTLERSQNIIKKSKQLSEGTKELFMESELLEEIGYRNSEIQISEAQVLKNICSVQRDNNIYESKKLERPNTIPFGYNLTVEMETGTGKTYTYIRTMYELHKHYGWSKFIIVVPSIAIREGVYKSFEITQNHFQELFGHKINTFIYNSSRPQDIENFASDSRISVMIINTQAFNASGADARRIYQELDQFGTRKPIDIISKTNPILIIDEPQSVEGEKTLKSLVDFKPLFTLRYSATHKNEYNKIFRLDALDAYNSRLVKKIQVKGISLKGSSGTSGYLYLQEISLSTTRPPYALVEYEKRSGDGVKKIIQKLHEGDNLYELSGGLPAYKNHLISEINGYLNKIVINGQDIYPGEIINYEDEKEFRRIQIRETILSHLQKEKALFNKGIKVLSLFFIDSVDKYRIYDESNNALQGEYAFWFEDEYQKAIDQIMNDSDEYTNYLKQFSKNEIHTGYFSIDKKGLSINPSLKRGSDDSDDISAYDLIMKDKERLLSFEEPVRFIFSHSALKEGWDNPNVFQICALKNSDTGSQIRRRQELGRGMRICVNKDGYRQDFDYIGEEVHEINKLTVVASESYEDFAKGLQNEIADSLKGRPQKADISFFVNKVVKNDQGDEKRISKEEAEKINKFLFKFDVLDENNKITDIGREKIEAKSLPLPDEFKPYKESIISLLQSIYTDNALSPVDERKTITLSLNDNFKKKEFQELWNKINIKTIYEVNFDNEKIIDDSINKINKELTVSEKSYEIKTGELLEGNKEEIEDGTLMSMTNRSNNVLGSIVDTNAVYDLVGEIEAITNLTRKTIVEILKNIESDKFDLVKKNTEEFIAKCGKIINAVKATLIINNINYLKTDERYEAKTVFTNDKSTFREPSILKKHIYDYLTSDSKIESAFTEDLEASSEVIVYAKLPKSFQVSTPIANYSPDWAIVFDKEKVKHIYFIAETKGSDSDMDLREIEKLKIHCAEKHFSAIGDNVIRFAKVSSFDQMIQLIH